jgi:site-specific DNA-methyltransferase (adenine-specific)
MIDMRQGDCRVIAPTLAAQSVDLVLADPPYGETSLVWDRWPVGWLEAMKPCMKPSASLWVFGSLRMFMERADEFKAAGFKMAQEIVWEKHNGSNAFTDRFRRVHELAAQFYLGDWSTVYKNPLFSADTTAKTVRRKSRPQQWGEIGDSFYESEDGGPRMLRSVWCVRSEHGRAVHPTQKPLGIIAPLIEYSCPPGGTILDPMCGSGTTGIAARARGCSAILIEGDDANFAVAQRRIQNDSPLFAEVA